ncbi:MAG: peptidyl-prolyl cis-trans isomerase [candidate division Zixibacteria bacterium]|nr:peptidyl-prolyl cis-trans isomerase [candidate division Zixibacteria bacterium]
MFNALRKMILPIIIIVLVFFAGMIVLQWGLDITSRNQPGQAVNAGVINGEEISWNAFQQVYSSLYQSELSRTDDEIPDDRLRELESQAWQQILQDRLLMQQAEENNIVVTADDIYEYLKNSPPAYLQQAQVFQTDGRFDYQKYRNLMADPNAAGLWAQLEPQIRADLMKIKLQTLIVQTVQVTDQETKQAFLDGSEKVKVGWINCDLRRFTQKATQPTEEEQRAYFEEHRNDYEVGERMVLSYVKTSRRPTEDDWAITRAIAQDLADSARAGADFADLAISWSEDAGSAKSGGDLGWFASGRMVGPFDSAAFAMKDGEISNPIRTQFGWHVIKHEGFRTTDGKKEAKASHILLKVRASAQTEESAYRKVNDFANEVDAETFTTLAEERGLSVATTAPFEVGGTIRELGGALQVSQWAAEAKLNEISYPIEVGDDYCVVRVDQKLPAGLAEFDAVKEQVRQAIYLQSLKSLCHDTAQAAYALINGGMSLEKAAKQLGLTYETPDPFARNAKLSQLSSDAAPIGAAFALNESGQITPPVDYDGGTVIIQLFERTSPDLTEFNEKKDSVSTNLLYSKRQQVYTRWFEKLIAESEIQNNTSNQRRGTI